MTRIATCMGLDPDNKSYLEQRDGSAAGFVNWLIRKYREKEDELRKTIGDPPGTSYGNEAIVSSISKDGTDTNAEIELKARSYLADNPQILYTIKKGGPPNQKQLCRLKDEMFYSKYVIDITVPKLRKILREEVARFDLIAYEDARGIPRERK